MKKKPKIFEPLDHPVLIVGEKMGRQRFGQDTYALEGNRTGDFVHEAIEGMDNIILTNIVNWYYPGKFDHKFPLIIECIQELQDLIDKYQPNKIITLGGIAWNYMVGRRKNCDVIPFPHPSYINRFHSSQRSFYVNKLRSYVSDRKSTCSNGVGSSLLR